MIEEIIKKKAEDNAYNMRGTVASVLQQHQLPKDDTILRKRVESNADILTTYSNRHVEVTSRVWEETVDGSRVMTMTLDNLRSALIDGIIQGHEEKLLEEYKKRVEESIDNIVRGIDDKTD